MRKYVVRSMDSGATWRVWASSPVEAFHYARCNGAGSDTLECLGTQAFSTGYGKGK